MSNKNNPLSDHPILTGIAAGVGAGLFYKHVTEKLLKDASFPPALKSELDVLSGQADAFHPKAMEDLEMKEMNETMRRCSAEDNPDGIIEYATKRLETNRELLEDVREIEKTIFKIRGMTEGSSDDQQGQLQEVINPLLEFEQDFHATLKIQRTILELIQTAYQTIKESGSKTLPDATKLRMQTLSKEYSNAILKSANDVDVFQKNTQVKNAESKSTSTDWGAVAVKVVVAIFSILGAMIVAVIGALGKMNEKK